MNHHTSKEYLASMVMGGFLAAYAVSVSASLDIEEITVTAEKRETSLQDTPVSVSAFTAEGLDRANINSVVDLSGKVPGLTINKNEGPKQVVTIRGIGHEANQNGQSVPGVAMHVNGVFMPFTYSLNADFLDVERIEVLRGPQGTVFGQNSTGGAINIITKRPELDDFEGKVDLAVGNYNHLKARGMVNIPLSETAAARFSVSRHNRDGYTQIVDTPLAGTELDEADSVAFRGQLLWQPSEQFSAVLRASGYKSDTNSNGLRNVLDPGTDVRKVRHNQVGTTDIDQQTLDIELQYDMSWATFKSITAVQDVKALELDRDSDLGDATFFNPQAVVAIISENRDIFTQEINLVSNAEDSNLDWLVGLFYLVSDGERTFTDFDDENGDGLVDVNLANPSEAELGFTSFTPAERTSFSIYAQGTYHFSETFRSTLGFRWTDDEIEADVSTFFRAPNNFLSSVTKVTGKVDVQWDVQADAMLYLSLTTGLKPGGVNTLSEVDDASLIDNVFSEEEVRSLELGLKSRFGDGRYQLNAAAFAYDYDGFQFHGENFRPFSGGVGNVDDVQIQGLELELQAVLTDTLRLDANLAFLDGEVGSDKRALAPVAARKANQQAGSGFSPRGLQLRAEAVGNLNGNKAPKLPDFAANITLTHAFQMDAGLLTTSLAFTHVSNYDYTIFNDPGLGVPSAKYWDLAFSYQPDAADWNVDLLVTNLADDDEINARWTNVFGAGQTSEQYIAPRQVMLRAGYRF